MMEGVANVVLAPDIGQNTGQFFVTPFSLLFFHSGASGRSAEYAHALFLLQND